MEQFSYLRPREKLRSRGVQALVTSELLQIIISSGGNGISSARIAKHIEILLTTLPLSYEGLLKIQGVGEAKASQIIAAIELGSRISNGPADASIVFEFHYIKSSPRRIIEYLTVDGAGMILHTRIEGAQTIEEASLAIRKLFACALRDLAASIIIGIGYKKQSVDSMDDEMLGTIKKLFDTASLLQIRVDSVWLVNQSRQTQFSRKALK